MLSKSKNEVNFKKSKSLSKDIDLFSKSQEKTQKEIINILATIPNIALDDVPVGNDEISNKITKKVGKVKKFSFNIKF